MDPTSLKTVPSPKTLYVQLCFCNIVSDSFIVWGAGMCNSRQNDDLIDCRWNMADIKAEIYNQLMLNWVEHADTWMNRCSLLLPFSADNLNGYWTCCLAKRFRQSFCVPTKGNILLWINGWPGLAAGVCVEATIIPGRHAVQRLKT